MSEEKKIKLVDAEKFDKLYNSLFADDDAVKMIGTVRKLILNPKLPKSKQIHNSPIRSFISGFFDFAPFAELYILPTKERLEQMKKDHPEEAENYKKIEPFLSETAYVMPTFDTETNTIKHAVVVSENLYNELKKIYGDDEKALADALRFAAFHEISHIRRGDVFPWKQNSVEKAFPNLNHQDFNIIYDSDINASGMQAFPNEGKALLDHLGIRGNTLPSFVTDLLFLQASHDIFKDNPNASLDDYAKALNERMDYYAEQYQVKNGIDASGLLKEFAENPEKFKEFRDKLANLKDFEEAFKAQGDYFDDRIANAKKRQLIAQEYDKPKSFANILGLWKDNLINIENNNDHTFLEPIIMRYYDLL